MVEYTLNLDEVFGSLADATRRDILERVSVQELSVGQIAQPYDLSLAAVSKHLKILERARLVRKRRQGKQQLVQASPLAFKDAEQYLQQYGQRLERQLDALENYLMEEE
jgi:DNA-binding transcriptional ArsR family regulator